MIALQALKSPLLPIGLWVGMLVLCALAILKITPQEMLYFILPSVLLSFTALTGVKSIYFTILWLSLVLSFWIIKRTIHGGTETPQRAAYVLPFIAIGLTAILSVLFNSKYTVSFGSLAQCLALAPLYWLIVQVLSGVDYRRLFIALILGSVVAALSFLVAFAGGSPGAVWAGMVYGFMRPVVLEQNPNSWALYPLMGLPLIAGLWIYGSRDWRNWLWLLPSALALLSVALITMSRSALLGVLMGLLFLLAAHPRGRRFLVVAPFVGLVALLALSPDTLSVLESVLRLRSGLSGRGELWSVVLAIMADHPLLGVGPGGLHDRYFFYAPYLPNGLAFTVDPPSAHNAFLNVGVELGIPAMLLTSTIFILFAYRSYLLWNRLKGRPDFAILVICSALMVAGFFRALFEVDFILPHGYVYENLLLITVLAVQDQLYNREFAPP